MDIKNTVPNAWQLIESLRVAHEANGDIDFEYGRSRDIDGLVFQISWTDEVTEMDTFVFATMDYTADYNDINYEKCVDIDYLDIFKVTYGDGYDQKEIEIPEGLNEKTLAPALTMIFDKHNEGCKFKDEVFSINLVRK